MSGQIISWRFSKSRSKWLIWIWILNRWACKINFIDSRIKIILFKIILQTWFHWIWLYVTSILFFGIILCYSLFLSCYYRRIIFKLLLFIAAVNTFRYFLWRIIIFWLILIRISIRILFCSYLLCKMITYSLACKIVLSIFAFLSIAFSILHF